MQTLSADQLVGRTLGDYHIEHLLGHAQLGAAYLARQLSQGRTVMVSTFNFPEGLSTGERNQVTSRIARERAALARLAHPNILPIYDFGEQSGYLYMVTAFVKGASLGQVLKQLKFFTPDQALDLLKQLAAGLDYAHSQGIVHGILSHSNVLLSNEFSVNLAGFGLRAMLEVQGQTQNSVSQAYLFSTSGAFLGSPEYVSPECVLGGPVDARSDIYALGVMLFELLSGMLPFSGANPSETALKRIQQPIPSVHAVRPDVSEAFDLVISKALERDPSRRYQRAGDIAAAFEHVLTMLDVTRKGSDSRSQQLPHSPQLTLPPTVNWFAEADTSTGEWQLVPPIVTGHMPAVTTSLPLQNRNRDVTENVQVILPGSATQPGASPEMLPTQAAPNPNSMAGVDPFAWWSATSDKPVTPPTPGTFTRRAPVRLAHSNPRARRRPARQDRRRFVTLMVAGTAGVLTVGGISFAHLVQSMKQSQPQSHIATVPTTGSTSPTTTQGNTPTVGTTAGTHNTPTPSKTPTAKPSPSATNGAQPSPTSQPTQQPTQQPTPKPTPPPPTPTPTPPSHTGTVIGHTNMSNNSSVTFNNPADGQGSLLMRLSNGNFVACERACTHAGVPVDYDTGSGQLVCPAHGAIFDPVHGFSHTSGPGNGPLANVSIRVNADGTITTG